MTPEEYLKNLQKHFNEGINITEELLKQNLIKYAEKYMVDNQEIKVLDHGFVRLVDVMGNDDSIVQAARVSYGKNEVIKDPEAQEKDDKNLIRYLYRHKHTTPFEMCLAADTSIPCFYREGVTAKSYTIKELSDAFEKGGRENFWVKLVNIRTVNKDGIIVSTKIKKAWKTGKKKVYKVIEDSLLGREIVCTDNHPFLTPTGYKNLKELQVGDSIFQNGTAETCEQLWNEGHTLIEIGNTVGKSQTTIFRILKNKGISTSRRKGFIRKQDKDLLDPRARARRSVASKICVVTGLAAQEIHHLDQNPSNNCLENLAPVNRKIHKAFHHPNYFPDIVYIRKIKSIEYVGEQDVYDLEVCHPNHNFVANGFVVHNCEFKFHCKMPIFVARQWIRHRTASVNEISGRYTELKDEFYEPSINVITKQNPTNKQGGTNEPCDNSRNFAFTMSRSPREAFQDYNTYIKSGMRKELARINLPLSTYTEWYWKIDLHNLLHFLSLRMDSHAQYEIRVFAEAMYELIKPIVPVAVQAFDDYHPYRNARTLSAMEQKLLSKVITNDTKDYTHVLKETNTEYANFLGMTKREQEEFWSWFNGDICG